MSLLYPSRSMVILDASIRESKQLALNMDKNPSSIFDSIRKKLSSLSDVEIEFDISEESAMSKDKWVCSITFRLTGVPGKNKQEALENFRKWIGNQLRDTSSSIRKKFFKLAEATKGEE